MCFVLSVKPINVSMIVRLHKTCKLTSNFALRFAIETAIALLSQSINKLCIEYHKIFWNQFMIFNT